MCSKIRNLLEAKPQREHTPVYFASSIVMNPFNGLSVKAQDFFRDPER